MDYLEKNRCEADFFLFVREEDFGKRLWGDFFIFPKLEIDGIRMADQKEIAAMKMLAIGGPLQRQKDYWDIHDMLSDYTLDEMIQWGLKRNMYSLTEQDIMNGIEQYKIHQKHL